jgi:hypothetical protein
MKQLLLAFSFTVVCLTSFSQIKKTTAVHNPAAKKPATIPNATSVKTSPEKVAPEIKEPEVVLSPAEKRQRHTLNAISQLLNNSTAIGSDYQEMYELMTVKTAYCEYSAISDTAAIVYLKNRLNHTIHKLDIRFEQELPRKIYLYSLSKADSYSDVKNSKWTNGLSYSFQLHYDSLTRLDTVSHAYKGWDDVSHHVQKYTISYKGNFPDSIELKDHMLRKRNVVYFNGKSLADSVYNFAYNTSDFKVFFYDKVLLSTIGSNERTKNRPLDKTGFQFRRMIVDSAGHVILWETRNKNPHYDLIGVTVDVSTFEANGSIKETKRYGASITNAGDATDSIISRQPPYISTYVLNGKNQVVKEEVTFHDRCTDLWETTIYTLDNEGFVTETKTDKKVNTKCRY